MVPITIITGFLGAGKTTLINKIIAAYPGKKFGFVINEFGAVGIDGMLVEAASEDIVELANGCICCTVQSDLEQAITRLLDKSPLQHLLIETSGLAEPQPVVQTIINSKALNARVFVDAVICVIDEENFNLAHHDYNVGKEQLSHADIAFITKESTTKSKIRKQIKEINARCAILNGDSTEDLDLLLDTNAWVNISTDIHQHDHEHQHVEEIVFENKRIIPIYKFKAWMAESIPAEVVRAKGVLELEVFPGQNGYFIFQMVGATQKLIPSPTDLTEKGRNSGTKLVFIGRNINKEALITSLEQLWS